jgi:hypothetical protein
MFRKIFSFLSSVSKELIVLTIIFMSGIVIGLLLSRVGKIHMKNQCIERVHASDYFCDTEIYTYHGMIKTEEKIRCKPMTQEQKITVIEKICKL